MGLGPMVSQGLSDRKMKGITTDHGKNLKTANRRADGPTLLET